MKNILIKACSLALILVLSLSLFSCGTSDTDGNDEPALKVEQWEEKLLKSDPDGVTYTYYFENVEDLLSSIKHDPEKYNNARVKVIGTLQVFFTESEYDGRLVDFVADSTNIPSSLNGVMDRYNFNLTLGGSKYNIYLNIINDAQYAVAEDGDYAKIYGTVRLERDNIYIDAYEYDLIATLDERRQNVKTP